VTLGEIHDLGVEHHDVASPATASWPGIAPVAAP
jgi:hypothetical protein